MRIGKGAPRMDNTRHRKLRAAAIKLHGNYCYYCGRPKPLSLDHKVPLKQGGTDELDNLAPVCRPCNSLKGTRLLEDVRFKLVQALLGWPQFSAKQLAWMRENGADLSILDTTPLWFERPRDSREMAFIEEFGLREPDKPARVFDTAITFA